MTQNHIELKDLKKGLKNIFIKDVLVLESELKTVNVKGVPTQVSVGMVIDSSVKEPIEVSAWGFVSKFLIKGKKIKLINCYCKEYPIGSGKLQITTGNYGKIEILKDKIWCPRCEDNFDEYHECFEKGMSN